MNKKQYKTWIHWNEYILNIFILNETKPKDTIQLALTILNFVFPFQNLSIMSISWFKILFSEFNSIQTATSYSSYQIKNSNILLFILKKNHWWWHCMMNSQYNYEIIHKNKVLLQFSVIFVTYNTTFIPPKVIYYILLPNSHKSSGSD